jgi:hypothetical protein
VGVRRQDVTETKRLCQEVARLKEEAQAARDESIERLVKARYAILSAYHDDMTAMPAALSQLRDAILALQDARPEEKP